MRNCRWLLCLVVIGLATRRAFSMDEQPPDKNDSSKTPSSDGNEKPHDDTPVKNEQALHSSLTGTTDSGFAEKSTNSKGAVALVPDAALSTSVNAAAVKLGSHDQSHSKRHFRRSKLYRKEAKAKSRSSFTKSSVAIGGLTPFSAAENLVAPIQDVFRNPNNKSDSIKLPIESIPKTSGTSTSKAPHAATTLNRNDSIPVEASSRSLITNGSKERSDSNSDNSSSTMTATSSASTDNYDSSSSSSGSGSVIDEKSSSVELMTFTFDSIGKLDQSTSSKIEVTKPVENSTTPALMATDHSSSKPIATVQTSDKSIDNSKSTSADSVSGGIHLGQSIQSVGIDVDDDLIIYSVHTESSRGTDHLSNELSTSLTRDNDSVIPVSALASESMGSNHSWNQGAKRLRNADNDSGPSRLDIGGYSWVSVNDSLNRISLADVIDTLKNSAGSQDNRGSYSYSNSTLSQDENSSLDSRLRITDTRPVSTQHSRSLTVPVDVAKSPRELGSSMNRDPELRLFDRDNPHASPIGTLSEEINGPLKLKIPLQSEEVAKARTKNNISVGNIKASKPTTSADFSSRGIASSDEKIVRRKAEPLRTVLDLKPPSSRCFSDSSIDALQNTRRIDNQNPFYQRRANEMTMSISGNSIFDPEQCLTMRSPAQTSFPSTVVFSNSDETDVGASISSNKSHEASLNPGVSRSSASAAIDQNRGAQRSVSSGIIILENFEPVVRESLASEGAVVPFETEATTATHFFAAFADLEEHCNASSPNVFIPSINSRESIIAAVKSGDESLSESREPQNLTTTEDSLYIIEGFGFLKNNAADEFSELEEEFDRRRDAAFDYVETETYPGDSQLDDHLPAVKLAEAELPVKQEPLIAAGLRWKENVDDRSYDQWWLSDGPNRRTGLVENNEAEKRTVLIQSRFPNSKEEIRVIQSISGKVLPDMNNSKIEGYRMLLLPTIYVLIGVCIILLGCSIWCSKASVKRKPSSPKLTYYIQETRETTEAVV